MTNAITTHTAPIAPAVNGSANSIHSISELTELAGLFVQSGFFADVKDIAQAAIKILAGRELGIGPFESMTSIHIIKGKVALSAGLIAARIRASGRYDYRIVRLDNTACEIEFTDRGKTIGVSRFTVEDAKAAGLAGRDMWRQYARNMLFARALTNGARWYCPDVFGGNVYTPDELHALPIDSVPPVPIASIAEPVDTTIATPVILTGVVAIDESTTRNGTTWARGTMTHDGEAIAILARDGMAAWMHDAHGGEYHVEVRAANHPTIRWEVVAAQAITQIVTDDAVLLAGSDEELY